MNPQAHWTRWIRRALLGAFLLAGLPVVAETVADKTPVRDSELVELFQDPYTALGFFPRDREKRPDWVDALRRGEIQPRQTLRGEPRPPDPMGDAPQHGILFTNTKQMPNVLFPHQAHAEWLACANCHDGLFERRSTGRLQGMQSILDGKQCGVCHGRVAFSPEGSCYRCHSQATSTALIQTPPSEGAKALEDLEAAAESGYEAPRRRRSGSGGGGGKTAPIISAPAPIYAPPQR